MSVNILVMLNCLWKSCVIWMDVRGKPFQTVCSTMQPAYEEHDNTGSRNGADSLPWSTRLVCPLYSLPTVQLTIRARNHAHRASGVDSTSLREAHPGVLKVCIHLHAQRTLGLIRACNHAHRASGVDSTSLQEAHPGVLKDTFTECVIQNAICAYIPFLPMQFN